MPISEINKTLPINYNPLQYVKDQQIPAGNTNFGEILKSAMDGITNTDNADKNANYQLITGIADNAHQVIIEGEKAELTLRMSIAVRNRVVEAYQEIMRMQF